jgi:protein-S-isoprenylcysteine O-methyltransferase Ste14
MLKWSSVAAFGLMVAGLVVLLARREVLAHSVAGVAVQAMAVLLMVLARIAFGIRSFHATANPTAGGLVTRGPYRWLRHPIYAAVLYFCWAAALDYRTPAAFGAAALVTIGAFARMFMEERLLVGMYPEYRAYAARTARVIPFVL